VDGAHAHGLRLLLDVVAAHTSIEHPWFAAHPERYVWSQRDGPQNNWASTFGGSAWSPDPRGRGWYLHSFYPEQPDLDWRREDVRTAFAEVLRFWRARGVDGFRLDALDRLLKDPRRRDDPLARAAPALPSHPDHEALEHRHSRDAPDVGDAVAALRAAAGDDALLIGEVFLTSDRFAPYLEHVDACFCFELLLAPWEPAAIRTAIEGALRAGGGEGVAWVLSNHDWPRLPTRVGPGAVRAAALLLLMLPGCVFIFQGDEIGLGDGPGRGAGRAPDDRSGRDAHRHPMQWDGSPRGGFSAGEPWLPPVDPAVRNVAAQEHDHDSILWLYRDLIAVRRELRGTPLCFVEAEPGVLAFTRGGDAVVVINAGPHRARAPATGPVVRATHRRLGAPGGPPPRWLAPGEGFVATTVRATG